MGPKRLDLKGKRFGRLIAVEDIGRNKYNYRLWRCKCDCGNETICFSSDLKNGHTQSCGCFQKQKVSESATTHGVSGSRLYVIWSNIKSRCYKKTGTGYQQYGAKGITVCSEWKNDFITFQLWAINNGYTDEMTIDRINNSKGYTPTNCRFVKPEFQSRNRDCCFRIPINGNIERLPELAKRTGIHYDTLRYHYHKGDIEQYILKK